MQKLVVTLETVTPLFLGGANPKGQPELRPPPFRGLMRYWFRALVGGIIGDSDYKNLHTLESDVFGSPDKSSKIALRLHTKNRKPLKSVEKFILPHNKKGRRFAFETGEQIYLTLQQTGYPDLEVWNVARTILPVMLTFGGVGLRSRRGYGTLRIVESSSNVNSFPTTLSDWEAHIIFVVQSAIEAARQFVQAQNIPTNNLIVEPTSYPCATKMGLIRLCDLQQNTAMDVVIHFMKQVRKWDALGRISPRQASPLWVRPIQTEKRYGLLCTVLASQFNGADYKFVKDWLHQTFPGKDLQVKGWNL